MTDMFLDYISSIFRKDPKKDKGLLEEQNAESEAKAKNEAKDIAEKSDIGNRCHQQNQESAGDGSS